MKETEEKQSHHLKLADLVIDGHESGSRDRQLDLLCLGVSALLRDADLAHRWREIQGKQLDRVRGEVQEGVEYGLDCRKTLDHMSSKPNPWLGRVLLDVLCVFVGFAIGRLLA